MLHRRTAQRPTAARKPEPRRQQTQTESVSAFADLHNAGKAAAAVRAADERDERRGEGSDSGCVQRGEGSDRDGGGGERLRWGERERVPKVREDERGADARGQSGGARLPLRDKVLPRPRNQLLRERQILTTD